MMILLKDYQREIYLNIKWNKNKEWHNAVVQGLVGGLTHTIWDGREMILLG